MTTLAADTEKFRTNPAQFIEQEIKRLAHTSPANRMPGTEDFMIFDEPLIGFADGRDTIFTQYKTVIATGHLTPREALARAFGKSLEEAPTRLSVISWVLPITGKTRESNRRQTQVPSRLWALTYVYGEKFNELLRTHMVEILGRMGYLAVAPTMQPYYATFSGEKGSYANWSERHMAYAAGLGTFSLSDGFITGRGIAHRCGSVVTDLVLPQNPRSAENHYSNCLFYVDGSCKACIGRCPAGAITENGHNKVKCRTYAREALGHLPKEYGLERVGCGLCQVKVPCEARVPKKKGKNTQ